MGCSLSVKEASVKMKPRKTELREEPGVPDGNITHHHKLKKVKEPQR